MNLSSSSSEEDYSSNDDDIQQKISYMGVRNEVAATATATDAGISKSTATVADTRNTLLSDSDDNGNGDEFDDIDWEDGDDGDEDENEQDITMSLQSHKNNGLGLSRKETDTSLSLNKTKSGKEKQKQRKRRRGQFKKIQISSSQVKTLLQNIQQTHLLALTSRSIFHSSFFMGGRSCSNPATNPCHSGGSVSNCSSTTKNNEDGDDKLVLNVAYSLIPMEFLDYSYSYQNDQQQNQYDQSDDAISVIPSRIILNKFCAWFFEFVNHHHGEESSSRRRSSRRGGRGGGNRKRNSEEIRTSTAASTRRSKRLKKNSGYHDGDNSIASGGKGVMKQRQQSEQDDTYSNTMHLHLSSHRQNRLLRLFKYLSIMNSGDPNIYNESHTSSTVSITPLEKTLVLICMMRSMGWRVRFVNAIDPVSQDLTVDHPLFSLGMKNAFQSIIKSTAATTKAERKKKRSKKASSTDMSNDMSMSMTPQVTTMDNVDEIGTPLEYPWIEVLIHKKQNVGDPTAIVSTTDTRSKSKSSSKRWIHVDPHFELIDEPSLVELIRGQKHNIKKITSLKKNGAMVPVSFVIAVEHTLDCGTCSTSASSQSMNHHHNTYNNTALETTRLTDVSPRYASKWSKTLRLRGATAKEIEKSGGNCSNIWWSKTIKKVNKYFITSRTKSSKSSSMKTTKSGRKVSKPSPMTIEKKETGEEVLVINEDSSSEDNATNNKNSCNEDDDVEEDVGEADELMESKTNEAIPTSKNAFKNHPLYVIPSVLKSQEVLAPDAKKRICGMFKGELVYKRCDVSTAMNSKKWLYEFRKVRESELMKPVKKIKARKKPVKKGFQALDAYGGNADESQADILAKSIAKGDFETKDGMVSLYGLWQTDPWSPPYIGPNDEIQVNEHKNVELALLNPGLVHLELYRISKVAKSLGISYAPCLIGFEGHGGNRTPTVRGIVVHEHNADLLREAHTEFESHVVEDAYKKKQDEIILRWKRLVNGVLTADRLKREYEKC